MINFLIDDDFFFHSLIHEDTILQSFIFNPPSPNEV
jgi:hypothetical protein